MFKYNPGKMILREAVEWDHVNWSNAFSFWQTRVPSDRLLQCLEIGGRRGGPSLWLASKGHTVVCTDLESPASEAFPLHKKFGLENQIKYAALNALVLPEEWEGAFDCVIFKSVLGGIARDGNANNRYIVIENIYKCLKPGGFLLFAENLKGSSLHSYFRHRFVRWGDSWNYLPIAELTPLFSKFERLEWETAGFFGAFGRREWQRSILGWIDKWVFDRIVGRNNRYIVFGIAWKARALKTAQK